MSQLLDPMSYIDMRKVIDLIEVGTCFKIQFGSWGTMGAERLKNLAIPNRFGESCLVVQDEALQRLAVLPHHDWSDSSSRLVRVHAGQRWQSGVFIALLASLEAVKIDTR